MELICGASTCLQPFWVLYLVFQRSPEHVKIASKSSSCAFTKRGLYFKAGISCSYPLVAPFVIHIIDIPNNNKELSLFWQDLFPSKHFLLKILGNLKLIFSFKGKFHQCWRLIDLSSTSYKNVLKVPFYNIF